MLPSFLAAATWIPAVLGLGMLVPVDAEEDARVAVLGFSGLAVLAFAAQVASFAVPVSGGLAAALLGVGLLAFAARARRRLARPGGPALAAVALGLLALALLAQDPFMVYDTGLYHLPSVSWLTGERLVPGLANLHGRLGFNSAWFATAAALEHPLLGPGRSAFVLNMLPPFFGACAAWSGTRGLIAGDRRAGTALLALLWIPVAEATMRVGSLKPDSAAGLLFFLTVALLLRAAESPDHFRRRFTAAALLASYALTVKVSVAPLPAMALAFGVLYRRWLDLRTWALAAGLAAAAVVPWAIRSVLLSGCLVYPVAATCFPSLPWSVPLPRVREEAGWIGSWARTETVDPPVGTRWLVPWTYRMGRSTVVRIAVALLAVGLWGARRRGTAPVAGVRAAGLGVMASLLYWFFTAPSPGYAAGLLLTAGALPVAAAVGRGTLGPRWALLATAACALSVAVGPFTSATDWTRDQFPLWRWQTFPPVEVRERTTDSGLVVRVPVRGDQCWATPRPCTPYFRPELARDGVFRLGPVSARGGQRPAR